MLFQRSKEKQQTVLVETPREVEEETIRRWRDMAAVRDRGDNKIVIGRFEDELAHSVDVDSSGSAPAWPKATRNFSLEETQIIEEDEEELQEHYLGQERYTLGNLNLDEEEEETVIIPPIQRREPSRTPASDASLSLEDDLKRRFGTNIRSALGPGTVIEGTFRFDSPVCVEGTLSGEVYSSSALIVGEGASVSGKITVGSLIVLGSVEGSVEADELIEIRSTGTLLADILTKRIAIEDGATYNGRCTLQD